MAHATIVSPTKAYVTFDASELELLKKQLTYNNTSIGFQLSKHLKNRWWKQKDPVGWQAKADELKAQAKGCLMFEEGGKTFVRPGSIPYIRSVMPITVENTISYPAARPLPWYRPVSFTPHPYQTDTVSLLIQEKHGNGELCTGAGKTYIIMELARKLGLKTIIMTPSSAIFNEMLEKFEHHFGKGMVGAIGDGKKRYGKLLTVCVSKSLSMLKPGTKEYDEVASAQVLIGDESHTIPAKTLESTCHGVLANIPYRFFLSGTQTRGDGTEKLLHSIIGNTVYSLSTKEAVEKGYIGNHEFAIVKVLTSSPGFSSKDPLEMKREHFLYNKNIASFIAKLANSSYELKKKQTLVLVDEVSQIGELVRHLTVPYACAFGPNDAADLKKMGLANVDPMESVDKFNRGAVGVLIGTSCISTGTNIYPNHNTVNWQGGASEIKTKQGPVGRSVRKLVGSGFEHLHTPKDKTVVFDFDIVGVDVMRDHLNKRIEYYKDSGTPIKFL